MMAITVVFTLSSVMIAMLHVGYRKSLQAHCASNMRTLWTTTKAFRMDERRLPAEYPEISFPELFSSYQLAPETFTCLEFQAETEDEQEAAEIDESEGAEPDIYSPSYIQPRDELRTDIPFCSCPYHDERGRTVVMTSHGRIESAETIPLIYRGEAADPRAVFNGKKLSLWDGGKVNLSRRLNFRLLSSYEGSDKVRCLTLKLLNSLEGGLSAKLPAFSRVIIVNPAGLAILDASEAPANFDVDFELNSGTLRGTVLAHSGKATVSGRHMSIAR